MPTLYGRNWTPAELQHLTGTPAQLAGIRLVEYADGKARGMRAAELWTGSGLSFTIWLDRGLDIGPAQFAGKPLAFLHPALGTPAQYEPEGLGWLRTFGGGLLTTCGLTHFGSPDQEKGGTFGLHGRASHIPAQNVSTRAAWEGDQYWLEVAGQVQQAVIFGENLLLTRRIRTFLGASCLAIEDRLENIGFRAAPAMVLYHCNFGFPVVSPDTTLEIDDVSVAPRTEVARAGLSDHTRFSDPDPTYAEQVFFHTPRPDAGGYVTATLHNHALGFGAYVRYRSAELPTLTQWKMMGAGEYVCGLEPCTSYLASRQVLRQEGLIRDLQPGEHIDFRLEIGVV